MKRPDETPTLVQMKPGKKTCHKCIELFPDAKASICEDCKLKPSNNENREKRKVSHLEFLQFCGVLKARSPKDRS